MEAIVVSNEEQMKDAYSVRRIVFIDEQQVPEEEEIDQYEKDATHVVLYEDNQPIGAGRFRSLDGIGKIERICVLKEFRNKGAGKVIMDKMEEIAKGKGISKLKLNAQTHAEKFYLNLGYTTTSDIFMDAGIPHVTMIKEL
ncbi:GNAT family N-acetyltransferase [Bacillus luteolus]|uniref:GNAT family N-acetyltransferase n=1 Tax=Litchfieldia luteola TaxID=682179 RepID=A0ABR9QLS4_9BACI|nr:GNAT family N-acetyltransferase [Cytobacillus luteolus]MBE4909448.1 GNAT family N-acetyltransferase [Cytobacillus luteolus]MBP1940848.1 putative GNAT family N-acyltransferase [Cytobacillus luteolus]